MQEARTRRDARTSPHAHVHTSMYSLFLAVGVCTGSRVSVLPARTSARRVQNSTRTPEVADDIVYGARVQIHVILRMSTQSVREGVHCGVTVETLPDRVPVENYPWKTTRTRYTKKMLPASALIRSPSRMRKKDGLKHHQTFFVQASQTWIVTAASGANIPLPTISPSISISSGLR